MRRRRMPEAEDQLWATPARTETAETIFVAQRGERAAEPVPTCPDFDKAKVRRAIAGLIEASRGLSLDGLEIKHLIGEGRA